MLSSLTPDEAYILNDSDFKLYIQPNKTSFINDISNTDAIFHEAIEIKYFLSGSSTLIIGTETIVTSPGDLIIINPYEFHSTVNFAEDAGKYHLIMMSLDFLGDNGLMDINLRHRLMGQGLRFSNLIHSNERLSGIISAVIDEKEREDEGWQIVIRALMTELFTLLLRSEVKNTDSALMPSKNIHYYEVIDPALQMIYKDYQKKLTIDDLADSCRISKYHFCRVFRQVTGMPAMQYLMNYRIKIADLMLFNTQKSVAEIAWECGFTDESYFCRCYKKLQGMSPLKTRAI